MTLQQSITIGVTGHRPNRLKREAAELAAELREVLTSIATAADRRTLKAISALAEGSDRLFAAEALRCGYALKALLPFARADYEATFSEPDALPEFRSLLSRATEVDEMPGSLADTKSAYELLGHTLVDASDVLVAVWDGQPAAGRGGSPEIIEYALHRMTPVLWVHAARPARPCAMLPSAFPSDHIIKLEDAAKDAIKLTGEVVQELTRLR